MADEWGRLPGHVRRAVRAVVGATLPAPCGICGLTVYPDTAWHVHHVKSVRDFPDLVLEPSNWTAAHAPCNQGLGARAVTVTSWSWP